MFLFVLFAVLVFILGVRYGQKIELTNKTIRYMISIPPTKPPIPTQPPLEFKTYAHSGCGIRFLIPNTLASEKETSTSGGFTDKKKPVLTFDCTKKSVTISPKTTSDIQWHPITLRNPKNGKTIYVDIKQSLFPLFDKSIEYM